MVAPRTTMTVSAACRAAAACPAGRPRSSKAGLLISPDPRMRFRMHGRTPQYAARGPAAPPAALTFAAGPSPPEDGHPSERGIHLDVHSTLRLLITRRRPGLPAPAEPGGLEFREEPVHRDPEPEALRRAERPPAQGHLEREPPGGRPGPAQVDVHRPDAALEPPLPAAAVAEARHRELAGPRGRGGGPAAARVRLSEGDGGPGGAVLEVESGEPEAAKLERPFRRADREVERQVHRGGKLHQRRLRERTPAPDPHPAAADALDAEPYGPGRGVVAPDRAI